MSCKVLKKLVYTITMRPLATPIEKRPGCISSTLEIIGDKWTPLIIRDLAAAPSTFGNLELSLVGISPRTLSARLDKLELEKIIQKHMYNEHPPRYRYELTQKGRELEDIIIKMADWGEQYSG